MIRFGSGPAVARLFHRALSGIFLVAWLSLLVQVRVLIGSRGLLPWADLLSQVSPQVGWLALPTALRFVHTDTGLLVGVWVGIALAAAGLTARWPRIIAAASTALYLSYVIAGRTFFSFQWDNLLIECGTLAALLPADRPAPWLHLAFRLLVFKLYFESGIAKYQSALGDWVDGSAMVLYYQTAPLPAGLAWWAYHLPIAWHHLESWGALVLELGVPFLIFGPRPARRIAFAAFTGFQVIDIATANYGFFCYLSLVLGLFLLDDSDLTAVGGRWEELAPRTPWRDGVRAAVVIAWAAVSAAEGWLVFGGGESPEIERICQAAESLRLANTYHLFGSITRERIEPQFEEQTAEGSWTELELHHKPGDPQRRPDWVAPHQPRVDFQLWFFGLRSRAPPPDWVVRLLQRICQDPSAVQPLFATPLAAAPSAERIVYWRYRFSTRAERAEGKGYWVREREGSTEDVPCTRWQSPAVDHAG